MLTKIRSRFHHLAIVIGFVALPSQVMAEQFTLMDVEFTFTKEDADTSSPSQSHYYVRTEMLGAQPSDWTTPIDYRNGSVHVRTEVIDKPAGSEVTQWTLCYIPNVGIGQGYGCTGSGTYVEEGLYERDEKMTSWWENSSLDWTKGINEMHLVIKDSDGGSGHAHKRADFEKFFPTTMRITMVQVSAGSTYDEALVPELQSDGTGGVAGTGGDAADGGMASSGGNSADGGTVASGGQPAPGGIDAAGGNLASGGDSQQSGNGAMSDGGEHDASTRAPFDTSGCTITALNAHSKRKDLSLLLAFAAVLLFVATRRLFPTTWGSGDRTSLGSIHESGH